MTPQSLIPTSLEEEQSLLLRQMGELRSRLIELELRERELLTRYANQSHLVQSARGDIQIVRGKLAELENRQSQLNQIEMEYNRLQREVQVHRENYQLYLSKFEESRISDAMDREKISNVSVIEPAKPPLKPISPKILLNMVLAIFLGGVGAVGLAFFAEYLGDILENDQDVESFLQLPVLASIPEQRT
jgi:uncharacterized protein involved in exopolysaccharide biosynthesis